MLVAGCLALLYNHEFTAVEVRSFMNSERFDLVMYDMTLPIEIIYFYYLTQ